MPETEEEKKARWARNAAKNAYMTPQMAHAMNMSKFQSQNKYKESFTKTKGKGYTVVSSTPEIEHAKKQSIRVSQNKYRADFEKNKGKFTSVTDDPETQRVKRVTKQVSKIAYSGKGSAIAEGRNRKIKDTSEIKQVKVPVINEANAPVDDSFFYGRPVEVEETITEEPEETGNEKKTDTYGRVVTEEEVATDQDQQEATNAFDYSHQQENESYQEEPTPAAENGTGYVHEEDDTKRYSEDDIDVQQNEEYPPENNNGQQQEEQAVGNEEDFKPIEGDLDDFYANLG